MLFKNKKILIFDNQSFHLKMSFPFDDYFSEMFITDSVNNAIKEYKEGFFNLIIVNISKNHNSLEFIKEIKKISRNKPIVLVSDSFDQQRINLFSSYYVDGIIFSPFLTKHFISLLTNIFERQEEQDNVFFYLKEIEKYQNNAPKRIEKKRVVIENYETDEFISPDELFEVFGDTLMDKIEELQGVVNNFSEQIYRIEQNKDNPYLLEENFHKVSFSVRQISSVLYSIQYFKIASKAFDELSFLLEHIKLDENILQNRESIINYLSLLDKDLISWIQKVFILRTAENIFYFDSSFLNNVYTIKNLILNEECEGSDIEFF